MGRILSNLATLAVLGSVLLPTVSATFDYQNILDENIAIYILTGIAAVYFSLTLILLLLAGWYCCRRKSPQLEKKEPQQDSNFQRAHTTTKTRLPTIPEDPPPTRQTTDTAFKRGSHRRVTRLRSDEEELINDSVPGDTDMVDTGPFEDTHPARPVRKTPDPRRKKTAAPAGKQSEPASPTSPTDMSDRFTTPRLPGSVSPVQNFPDKKVPAHFSHKTLPPLRKAPTLPTPREDKDGTHNTLPRYVLPYDYHKERPLRTVRDQRLNSPRNVRRMKEQQPNEIGMKTRTETKTSSPQTPSKKEELTSFISELDLDAEQEVKTPKKTHPDTSFVVVNPGYDESSKVRLLELQRQLTSVSHHWYKIGWHAGVSKTTLKTIEQIDARNSEQQLHKVCQEWLKKETELTWDGVLVTLRAGELAQHTGNVADEICRQFCQESSSANRSANSNTEL